MIYLQLSLPHCFLSTCCLSITVVDIEELCYIWTYTAVQCPSKPIQLHLQQWVTPFFYNSMDLCESSTTPSHFKSSSTVVWLQVSFQVSYTFVLTIYQLFTGLLFDYIATIFAETWLLFELLLLCCCWVLICYPWPTASKLYRFHCSSRPTSYYSQNMLQVFSLQTPLHFCVDWSTNCSLYFKQLCAVRVALLLLDSIATNFAETFADLYPISTSCGWVPYCLTCCFCILPPNFTDLPVTSRLLSTVHNLLN